MLEHVPAWLGDLLRNVRAGHAKLVIAQQDITRQDGAALVAIAMSSPAFGDGQRLPERFTADGAGISPPLNWGMLPDATASLALIVEDPDAPALQPLVHAIVWDMPRQAGGLAAGAITQDRVAGRADLAPGEVGRNSFMGRGWLPPDPPTGHGTHDYVFQLFALSEAPAIGDNPGRSAFVAAIAGRVLAAGLLIGTYSRGEPAGVAEGDALGSAVPA